MLLITRLVLQFCSGASWLGPLFLALPYAWRFCQCIRVFLDLGARPQLFNAVKYSTAFPVIALWAMRAKSDDAEWCVRTQPASQRAHQIVILWCHKLLNTCEPPHISRLRRVESALAYNARSAYANE